MEVDHLTKAIPRKQQPGKPESQETSHRGVSSFGHVQPASRVTASWNCSSLLIVSPNIAEALALMTETRPQSSSMLLGNCGKGNQDYSNNSMRTTCSLVHTRCTRYVRAHVQLAGVCEAKDSGKQVYNRSNYIMKIELGLNLI